MNIQIASATPADASTIAAMVAALTREICEVLNDPGQFDHDAQLSERLCTDWIGQGIYTVLLAHADGQPVGMAAIAESHALYAQGKIGIIQECYVLPAWRSRAVGGALLGAAFALAPSKGWACMELCTPPLPAFERSLRFYGKHGFKPVGGRKMRVTLPSAG